MGRYLLRVDLPAGSALLPSSDFSRSTSACFSSLRSMRVSCCRPQFPLGAMSATSRLSAALDRQDCSRYPAGSRLPLPSRLCPTLDLQAKCQPRSALFSKRQEDLVLDCFLRLDKFVCFENGGDHQVLPGQVCSWRKVRSRCGGKRGNLPLRFERNLR